MIIKYFVDFCKNNKVYVKNENFAEKIEFFSIILMRKELYINLLLIQILL